MQLNTVFNGKITFSLITCLLCGLMVSFSAHSTPPFDEQRAKNAGADEYGMKHYVMAFLKRGPNRDRTQAQAEQLQRAHLDNITRLANEGSLVLELLPWYGSAALTELNELHRVMAKKDI